MEAVTCGCLAGVACSESARLGQDAAERPPAKGQRWPPGPHRLDVGTGEHMEVDGRMDECLCEALSGGGPGAGDECLHMAAVDDGYVCANADYRTQYPERIRLDPTAGVIPDGAPR